MTQQALILLVVAVLGVAAVVSGVAVLWGAGWALLAGGSLAVAAVLLLLDPSDLRGGRR